MNKFTAFFYAPGEKLRKAIEEVPQNSEDKRKAIDYLRAIVPLRFCYALLCVLALAVIWLTRTHGSLGYLRWTTPIVIWQCIASVIIYRRAKTVLSNLENHA